MAARRMHGPEERHSAFQGSAFLNSNDILLIKVSEIQCLM